MGNKTKNPPSRGFFNPLFFWGPPPQKKKKTTKKNPQKKKKNKKNTTHPKAAPNTPKKPKFNLVPTKGETI